MLCGGRGRQVFLNLLEGVQSHSFRRLHCRQGVA